MLKVHVRLKSLQELRNASSNVTQSCFFFFFFKSVQGEGSLKGPKQRVPSLSITIRLILLDMAYSALFRSACRQEVESRLYRI